MLHRASRSVLVPVTFAALVLSACALPGRGGPINDDDEDLPSEQLTTTSSGSGGGDNGGGGATTSGPTTTAPSSSTTTTSGSPSSTPAATTTTTGGGSCPTTDLMFNDQVCGSCAESACCTPLQACDSSFDCLDFLGCLQGCLDQTCADNCSFSYPTGANEFYDLDDCMAASCSIECG